MAEDYSEDFASYARDFLNPELDEAERIEALKAAIHACMDEGSGEEDADEGEESGAPAKGLALVFGGGGKRKKA